MSNSFVLYGPPDIGKMTFLKSLPNFRADSFVDLSLAENVIQFKETPRLLENYLNKDWVFINHLDRVPSLIPIINKNPKTNWGLTSTYYLPELNFEIISDRFLNTPNYLNSNLSLDEALRFGLMLKAEKQNQRYLLDYVEKYVDDGILAYNKVRNLVAFHLFLEMLPELNGQKINFTQISERLNVDYKTIQNYLDLIINTHVGYYLNATDLEIRKVQNQTPTFYLFDTGVLNAFNKFKPLDPLVMFKTFCINETRKSSHYELSNYLTKDGVGVDLIMTNIMNGKKLFINFINERIVTKRHLKSLTAIRKIFSDDIIICVNLMAERSLNSEGIDILTPLEFLKKIRAS